MEEEGNKAGRRMRETRRGGGEGNWKKIFNYKRQVHVYCIKAPTPCGSAKKRNQNCRNLWWWFSRRKRKRMRRKGKRIRLPEHYDIIQHTVSTYLIFNGSRIEHSGVIDSDPLLDDLFAFLFQAQLAVGIGQI